MAAKFIILLLPIFITWKLLAPYTILPISTSVIKQVVNILFKPIQPQVLYVSDKDIWKIEIQAFKADQHYSHNTFKPKLKTIDTTSIGLGALIELSLNFPLFWLLMIAALSKRHWKRCLCNIATGSLIILASTCFHATLKAVYDITKVLQSSDLIRVYNAPYIQIPAIPPDWLLVVIKPLLDTFGYLSVLVIPIGLAYYYCYSILVIKNKLSD